MNLLILLFLTIVSVVVVVTSETASTIVNGGVYKIQSDNDQNVLTAADNGVLTKRLGITKVDVWDNKDYQKWTLRSSPSLVDGKTLRSLTSRKNANNNSGFLLSSPGSTATLRYWEFSQIDTGKWQIISYPGGKCLQNMGRTRAVEEKECSSTNRAQRWDLLICNSLRCSETK